MKNKNQQLINQFQIYLIQNDITDYHSALINKKTGYINIMSTIWDEIDYLKCSDQHYVYIHSSLREDKITEVKGALKRSVVNYEDSSIGVIEMHNC